MDYKSVAPYTKSSQIYDRLMEEVDYPGWCEYILDLAEEFGFGTRSIFDLSCGTGTFLHLFPATEKFGIDISQEMISRGKKNFPELHLEVGNMLHPLPRDVSLYINIHDALNYISDFNAIRDHIAYMDKHLTERQSYIFDFALPNLIKEYFDDTSYEDTNDAGISFRRHNHYDRKNKLSFTDLYIYHPDGRSYHERHIQYIFSFKEIQKLSVEFPSRSFIFLEEFSFEAANKLSNRLLVIMR